MTGWEDWTHDASFSDVAEMAGQLGLLRQLPGWRASLARTAGTIDHWQLNPQLWHFMLFQAGATPGLLTYPMTFDARALDPGEVVVYPDTVEPGVMVQASVLHQDRPVISESQLARWLWSDDMLEDMGLERFDPMDGRHIRGGVFTSVTSSHSSPRPGATVPMAPVRKVKRARRAVRPATPPAGFRSPSH